MRHGAMLGTALSTGALLFPPRVAIQPSGGVQGRTVWPFAGALDRHGAMLGTALSTGALLFPPRVATQPSGGVQGGSVWHSPPAGR
ncbi:MAG: hypothetical protein ACREMB_04950 [Candidatus Rokuibacteriota bacterium]